MSRSKGYAIGRRQSWMIPSLYIILTFIGMLAVYSSLVSQDFLSQGALWPPGYVTYAIQIAIGISMFFLVGLINHQFWQVSHTIVYVSVLLLLVLVLVVGYEVNGARSWFRLPGGISVQVAEMAKLSTALSLSAFLSYHKTDLSSFRQQFLAAAIILIPAGLVILQPDAGTALVFLSLFLVLYLAGLSPVLYLFVFGSLFFFIISEVFGTVVALFILLFCVNLSWINWKVKKITDFVLPLVTILGSVILILTAGWEEAVIFQLALLLFFVTRDVLQKRWVRTGQTLTVTGVFASVILGLNYMVNSVLKPHQKERIDVWLNPQDCNPQGSLYNILQSKMAITSGRFSGKGFLDGTMTRLDYVPEQSTDFIFSVIGEEQGFLGCMAVLVLFGILVHRLLNLATQLKSAFNRYFVICVAMYIFVHLLINIGMTLGIMPVVGIPLPLISKGGTAFIMFSIMLGIIQSFQYQRNA